MSYQNIDLLGFLTHHSVDADLSPRGALPSCLAPPQGNQGCEGPKDHTASPLPPTQCPPSLPLCSGPL